MEIIKNWQELSKVKPSKKYKLEIDIESCNGWINPIKETKETSEDYFKHHFYLSTHTFYGKHYKYYSKKLQEFGFNIELDNWDKEV